MSYNCLAGYYDALNTDADYDQLASEMLLRLRLHGVLDGIVADLGCGTGELTLRLAEAGYDMIGVDASPDMLSILRDKVTGRGRDVLLLCQDLAGLDLYGTVRAAVSSFDTFNHLPPEKLQAAMARAALFTEPGGLLIFDVNTPYKHKHMLAGNTFESLAAGGERCEWTACYDAKNACCHLRLTVYSDSGGFLCAEELTEYDYALDELDAMLKSAGYRLLEAVDGERFDPPGAKASRWLLTAQKTE